MTCQCICKCDDEACGDSHYNPKLCIACNLCEKWGNDKHGLPYVPTVWPKLEPAVPISNEQKDAAIEKALDGLI